MAEQRSKDLYREKLLFAFDLAKTRSYAYGAFMGLSLCLSLCHRVSLSVSVTVCVDALLTVCVSLSLSPCVSLCLCRGMSVSVHVAALRLQPR